MWIGHRKEIRNNRQPEFFFSVKFKESKEPKLSFVD